MLDPTYMADILTQRTSGVFMKLERLVPVLDVKDVEASIRFYCETLGFRVHDTVKWAGRTEWALLGTDKVQIMLCASNSTGDNPPSTSGQTVFFLYLDDIEGLRRALAQKGQALPRIQELRNGTAEFLLQDPDGYILWCSRTPTAQHQGFDLAGSQAETWSANQRTRHMS
ncbi:hypothetical protein RY27_09480 [Litorilinea aerophila]|nr:hypothetical protein RY27_09480 [Litorilinea aerophila]